MDDAQSVDLSGLYPTQVDVLPESLIEAVQRAVDEKGLELVTQDDIIRLSGIPRTTLYRRFGNRDAIIAAFVLTRISEDFAECQRLASGTGPFAERFEELVVFSVRAAHRHGWLQRELERGPSAGTLDLLARSLKVASDQTLMPMLAQAKAEGLSRCPAPLHELQRWLLFQIFEFSRKSHGSVDEARRIVRTYILPVLALEKADGSMSEKIDFIYDQLQGFLDKAAKSA